MHAFCHTPQKLPSVIGCSFWVTFRSWANVWCLNCLSGATFPNQTGLLSSATTSGTSRSNEKCWSPKNRILVRAKANKTGVCDFQTIPTTLLPLQERKIPKSCFETLYFSPGTYTCSRARCCTQQNNESASTFHINTVPDELKNCPVTDTFWCLVQCCFKLSSAENVIADNVFWFAACPYPFGVFGSEEWCSSHL